MACVDRSTGRGPAMSIQRYFMYLHENDERVPMEWVSYADHLDALDDQAYVLVNQEANNARQQVEDMRQACIAVVEELHDSSEPYSEAQETLWIALNALRQMTYNS